MIKGSFALLFNEYKVRVIAKKVVKMRWKWSCKLWRKICWKSNL